jgi:urease alpha subunit
MSLSIPRRTYADLYGPTQGDRVRLADTEPIIEVEKDFTVYSEYARAWKVARMVEAADAWPMNFGVLGMGNASTTEPLAEQVRAGDCGLQLHEDWGTSIIRKAPAVVIPAISFASPRKAFCADPMAAATAQKRNSLYTSY